MPLAHDYRRAARSWPRTRAGKAQAWLEERRPSKLGQHLKYDQHVLANHGIELARHAHDTLLRILRARIAQAPRHGYASPSAICGFKTISYEEVAGKGAKQIGFDQVELETATDYAAEDADITLRLHLTLWPQLQAAGRRWSAFTATSKCRLRDVLFRMERNGVLIDARHAGKRKAASSGAA